MSQVAQKEKRSVEEIKEKVLEVVKEQLRPEVEVIKDEHNFVDDLGADSLDVTELVMALEEVFGIEIPDADAEKIATVQQAIDYINEHQ